MNVMTPKIGSYVNNAAEGTRANVQPMDAAKTAVGNAARPAAVGTDSASFTNDAVQLSRLESSIAQIPVADHARVAQVRQAIADGTYPVDAQKIAAKMARMEWDLYVK